MNNHKTLLLLTVLGILTMSLGDNPTNDNEFEGEQFLNEEEFTEYENELGEYGFIEEEGFDYDTELINCLNYKDIPTSIIGDSNFQELNEPMNLRLVYTPAAIVLPTTPKQVQDAVLCAVKNNVKVQARSGGHSYASFSSGGQNGSLIINLENMHEISLDTSTGIVKAGGGVRLGNLAQGIYDQGKRALPHGTCPGIGVGGHFTHGGYGYTSRLWGLAMDTIVGLDVVLANGSYVYANSTAYPDIYWALRGAADSFGIVLNFYMQTQPAPDSITYFSYSFDDMFNNNRDTFTNTFLHLQDFAQNASVIDGRFAFGMSLDGNGYKFYGNFIGSKDEYTSNIEPELLRTLPKAANVTVESLGYIDYVILLSGQATLEEPIKGYNVHDNFFAKSITVPESDGLKAKTIEAFYDYITGTKTNASYFVIINQYGGPKSAINEKDTKFAAYSDRDALWVFQNYGETSDSIPFIDGMNEAVVNAQKETKFGAYLNYVDPSLTADEAHMLYYGDAVYSRLQSIKKVVDPEMLFWNPQAVTV